jgi:carbamoyl-phosphate synthase large subunit
METVLITASCLSPVGIDTIHSLQKYRKVIGVDIKDHNDSVVPYLGVKYYCVPMANKKEEYIEAILSICKQEKVDVILPLTIEETLVILSEKAKFIKNGIKIANSNSIESIEICADKWETINFLKQQKIEVPKTLPVFSVDDIADKITQFEYPDKHVVIKPRITHGSRGFKIITANKEVLSLIDELKPSDYHFITLEYLKEILKEKNLNSVLMEYLEGDDYSVYSFCINGEPLIILPMKRSGLIPGMSLGGVLEKNDEVIKYVKNILRSFGFSGSINIQLKNTPHGPLLYEINSRISATMTITLGAGLNFPLYDTLLAQEKTSEIRNLISSVTIPWGLKLHRIHREIYQDRNKFFEK